MPDISEDFADPAKSLELLDALEASGFDDKAFSVIHYHKEPMTIEAHRRYCSMLSEDGDEFKTINNRLVQRRLTMILTMYRSAGFRSGKDSIFVFLAKAALTELPHDTRPLSEQYAQVGKM